MAFTPTGVIILDFVLVSITFLLLILRLTTTIRQTRRVTPSDVLILIAWLCFLTNCLVDALTYRTGFWDPELKFSDHLPPFEKVIPDPATIKFVLKLVYGATPLFNMALYCIKTVFCLWYVKMFPKEMRKLRVALWVTIVLVVGGLIAVVGTQMFWCWPVDRNWTSDLERRCISWYAEDPYFFAIAMTIVTDMLVYTLPFFLLPSILRSTQHSAIRRRRLTQAIVLFSLGLLCLSCTAGRIVAAARISDAQVLSAWNAAEQASALIVVCLIPLGSLWRGKLRDASSRTKKVLRRRRRDKCCNCGRNSKKDIEAGRGSRESSVAKWDDNTEADVTTVDGTDFTIASNLHAGLVAPPGRMHSSASNHRVTRNYSRPSSAWGPDPMSSYAMSPVSYGSEVGFGIGSSLVESPVDEKPERRSANSAFWEKWRAKRSSYVTNVTDVTNNTLGTTNTFGGRAR